MKFKEVTERLGATVSDPGHADDGKPLNVARPHMASMRIWQAVHGGYTWVISYDPGMPQWTDEEKMQHIGYTASYRRSGHTDSSRTIRVDGGPWASLAKAEDACKRTWRQIRNAS